MKSNVRRMVWMWRCERCNGTRARPNKYNSLPSDPRFAWGLVVTFLSSSCNLHAVRPIWLEKNFSYKLSEVVPQLNCTYLAGTLEETVDDYLFSSEICQCVVVVLSPIFRACRLGSFSFLPFRSSTTTCARSGTSFSASRSATTPRNCSSASKTRERQREKETGRPFDHGPWPLFASQHCHRS